MLKKHPVILIISGVLLLIALGTAGVIWQLLATRPLTPDDMSGATIIRTSEGGLSGRGDRHNVNVKGTDLSIAQRHQVMTEVNQLGFFALQDSYTSDQCRDVFITTITLTTENRSKTVTFDDCEADRLPAGLQKFDQFIVTLSQK